MVKPWVRQEIKKDYLATFLENTFHWIREHRETALSILGIVLLVSGVSIYVVTHLRKTETRAWERFAFAQASYQHQQFDQALNLFNEVIQRYPRSEALGYVLYYKAEILFQQKRYSEASETYQTMLNQSMAKQKKKYLYPLATVGLSACSEGEGKFTQAIETYKQFIEKYPEHFFLPTVYLSLARCYQLVDKKTEAIDIYNKVITSYPESNWQKLAEDYLKKIATD